jgi:hypothetical protein
MGLSFLFVTFGFAPRFGWSVGKRAGNNPKQLKNESVGGVSAVTEHASTTAYNVPPAEFELAYYDRQAAPGAVALLT